MKRIRQIETLFRVKDTEYNRANFAKYVNASFETALMTADFEEYPADTVLTDIDYINLDGLQIMADTFGFDTVRIAIYEDSVCFVIGRNGSVLHVTTYQNAYWFFQAIQWAKENADVLLPIPEKTARFYVPKGKVSANVSAMAPIAVSDEMEALTEQSDDDNPYNNNNKGQGEASIKPRPIIPRSPNGGTAVRAPRQLAQRF